jgi:hypothetical protein
VVDCAFGFVFDGKSGDWWRCNWSKDEGRRLANGAHGKSRAASVTLKFADLLEQPNFDQIKIKAVIDDYTSGATSIATQGGSVILDIVAKLTPDERKDLAVDIRERAAHRGK